MVYTGHICANGLGCRNQHKYSVKCWMCRKEWNLYCLTSIDFSVQAWIESKHLIQRADLFFEEDSFMTFTCPVCKDVRKTELESEISGDTRIIVNGINAAHSAMVSAATELKSNLCGLGDLVNQYKTSVETLHTTTGEDRLNHNNKRLRDATHQMDTNDSSSSFRQPDNTHQQQQQQQQTQQQQQQHQHQTNRSMQYDLNTHIHVSNMHASLTVDELKSHIIQKCDITDANIFTVEKLVKRKQHKAFTSSFKISSNSAVCQHFLSKSFWPAHVQVRPFVLNEVNVETPPKNSVLIPPKKNVQNKGRRPNNRKSFTNRRKPVNSRPSRYQNRNENRGRFPRNSGMNYWQRSTAPNAHSWYPNYDQNYVRHFQPNYPQQYMVPQMPPAHLLQQQTVQQNGAFLVNGQQTR